jgi:NADH-quinone oxidoreductase subunit N
MKELLAQLDWHLLGPELTIIGTILVGLLLEIMFDRTITSRTLPWLGIGSILIAGWFLYGQLGMKEPANLLNAYSIDLVSTVFKLILLTGVLFVILLAMGQQSEESPSSRGEFFLLLLTASLGAMVITSASEMITLFVGLELLSLSSYILVGMKRKSLSASEAAWKYVIYGGVSSAFFLYGVSFLYGLTGSTDMSGIREQIPDLMNKGYEMYLYLAFFLLIVGIGFKLASAPFHMWAPDVYQGADLPVANFLAVSSKTAAFAMVLRILFILYLPLIDRPASEEILVLTLVALAALSMIVGNTVAIRQTQLKRLFAYSSIAHAGYIFLAILGYYIIPSITFYLVAYLFMMSGVFAVLVAILRQGEREDVDQLTGLYHRSPFLAVSLTVFLISLAGIPLTAGFIGKFYLAVDAMSAKHSEFAAVTLVTTMLITTVISYVYYFRLIRQMYFVPSQETKRLSVPWSVGFAIALCLVATVGLGVWPDVLMKPLAMWVGQ